MTQAEIDAARADIAASRRSSVGATNEPLTLVWPGQWDGAAVAAQRGFHTAQFRTVNFRHIAHHSPAKVAAMRDGYERALAEIERMRPVVEAVQAWSGRRDGTPALLAALGAYEAGGSR